MMMRNMTIPRKGNLAASIALMHHEDEQSQSQEDCRKKQQSQQQQQQQQQHCTTHEDSSTEACSVTSVSTSSHCTCCGDAQQQHPFEKPSLARGVGFRRGSLNPSSSDTLSQLSASTTHATTITPDWPQIRHALQHALESQRCVHQDRACARYHAGNQTGALLSMKKVVQLTQQLERAQRCISLKQVDVVVGVDDSRERTQRMDKDISDLSMELQDNNHTSQEHSLSEADSRVLQGLLYSSTTATNNNNTISMPSDDQLWRQLEQLANPSTTTRSSASVSSQQEQEQEQQYVHI